jgi:hypothetical protein
MVTEILNGGPFEFPLENDKKQFIEDYMNQHHCEIDSLVIDKIWIQGNKSFKHNNFYYNGTRDGIKVFKGLLSTSNVKSIKSKSNNGGRLNQAMREAIGNDMYLFKTEMLKYVDICIMCGDDFDLKHTELIHVDHCGTKEFRHIKDEFLSANPNLIVVERDDNDAGLTKLVDNEDKQLWIDFHHHSCKLQLICQTCNLKKAKK